MPTLSPTDAGELVTAVNVTAVAGDTVVIPDGANWDIGADTLTPPVGTPGITIIGAGKDRSIVTGNMNCTASGALGYITLQDWTLDGTGKASVVLADPAFSVVALFKDVQVTGLRWRCRDGVNGVVGFAVVAYSPKSLLTDCEVHGANGTGAATADVTSAKSAAGTSAALRQMSSVTFVRPRGSNPGANTAGQIFTTHSDILMVLLDPDLWIDDGGIGACIAPDDTSPMIVDGGRSASNGPATYLVTGLRVTNHMTSGRIAVGLNGAYVGRCQCAGITTAALALTGVVIENCQIENAVNDGSSCIELTDSVAPVVRRNELVKTAGTGVGITGTGTGAVIVENDIRTLTQGIILSDGNGHLVQRNRIEGIGTPTGSGMRIYGAALAICAVLENWVSGFSGANLYGVFVNPQVDSGADFVTILGNIVRNCDRMIAVRLDTGATARNTNLAVASNMLQDADGAVTNTLYLWADGTRTLTMSNVTTGRNVWPTTGTMVDASVDYPASGTGDASLAAAAVDLSGAKPPNPLGWLTANVDSSCWTALLVGLRRWCDIPRELRLTGA